MKIRADRRVLELGLAPSLAVAQALLLGGKIYWGERKIEKAGDQVPADCELRVAGQRQYVSRGGNKLEGALKHFKLNIGGLVCADLGASTGGFVDCLLQRGAAKVFAVDVGKGLLDPKVANDARVVVMDETNARDLTAESFDSPLDLVTVDVSFIGMAKIASALARILPPNGRLIAMIKPQFEADPTDVALGHGVIRDPRVRTAAIASACDALKQAGFALTSQIDSELKGPKGNLEHFVLAQRI
ncbi:MAG: TlyA family RNA methyltransferase [Polyangiaceae bacterium]|nr:TlyA family RNA methyltransferase [Polyangiaceae bacterium]